MFEKYYLRCLKALTETPFFQGECANLTISLQRLQIFIKYSKCFRKAMVDISTFKGEFRNSYFLLIWQFHNCNCSYSLSIVNTFARVAFGTVLFFQGLQFSRTATVKRLYLKHQIFVKTIYFFLRTTCSRQFFKVVCYFIQSINHGSLFF